jgi:hypothetical protein
MKRYANAWCAVNRAVALRVPRNPFHGLSGVRRGQRGDPSLEPFEPPGLNDDV